MKCQKLPMLKTGQIFVPYNYLQPVFLMSVTSRPKLVRVLSMPQVPDTIYTVDLHRATHISAENQTPCFVRFRVKLVRNTQKWLEQLYCFNKI